MSIDNKLLNFHDLFKTICSLVKNDNIPNSIIIDGKDGIGKTTFAKHLVNFIFTHEDDNPYSIGNFEINHTNKVFNLLNNNSYPNYYSIDLDVGKNTISIEQIRSMINYANKSSFNNKYKVILINNSEFLNNNSSNALLKILEEPSRNTIFIILQNSDYKNLKTIQSRCIKFNLKLDFINVIATVNKIISDDIYKHINKDLIFYYSTPGQIIDLLNFGEDSKINLHEITLNDFIEKIISKKLYAKNIYLKNNFNSYLEQYLLRLAMNKPEIDVFNYYDQFIKKSHDAKLFNLDMESLYINYSNNVLNG